MLQDWESSVLKENDSNILPAVVVIDGPAASGKSTTAKRVAGELGWLYLDTGAMYRAITVKVLKNRISLNDPKSIGRLVENIQIDFKHDKEGLRVIIDGEDVTAAIRTPEVDRAVGPVCEVDKVREVMVQKQRDIASNRQIVAEGRDMGTVVFPHADLKFYMVASIDERAKRRQEDLSKQAIHMSLNDIKNELRRRDERDSTRSNSPLMQAKDAICINTTKMKIEEQVDFIVDHIKKKQNPRKRNFQ